MFQNNILRFIDLIEQIKKQDYLEDDELPNFLKLLNEGKHNRTAVKRINEYEDGILVEQLKQIDQLDWRNEEYIDLCLEFELELKGLLREYRWTNDERQSWLYILNFVNANGWKEAFGENEPLVF